MTIENIRFVNEGYVKCKSAFYMAQSSLLSSEAHCFSKGINTLVGDIDSGAWAVSYTLSMYKHCPKDFMLFNQPDVWLNGNNMSLRDFSKFACYIDGTNPLFSSKAPLKKVIQHSLKVSGSNIFLDEIQDIFGLDTFRLEHPISSSGNEVFRAMSAIAYSCGKQVFCFPWMSQNRLCYYGDNISKLLSTLEKLDGIIIFPVGNV